MWRIPLSLVDPSVRAARDLRRWLRSRVTLTRGCVATLTRNGIAARGRVAVLARDVDLYSVATRTEGLSGAELAAVLEEAAVSAAVRNDTVIDAEDIEVSLDDARFNHDRA